MTEFNAQEIIDYISNRLLLYIGRHGIQNYNWQCENEKAIKKFAKDVRKVERYDIKLEQSGVCCLTCKLLPKEYEQCKNVQKCFATAIVSNFQEYSMWKPGLSIEDFRMP